MAKSPPQLSPAQRCIYNIPCCGGFCAPTVNPDTSCYKHVFNEYTVPASGALARCQGIIETNVCCRTCGRIGTSIGDQQRKAIGSFCCFLNFLAMIGAVIAVLGMSSAPDMLEKFYWVKGEVKLDDVQGQALGAKMEIYIGVNAQYRKIDCSSSVNSAAKAACETQFASATAASNGWKLVSSGVYQQEASWSDTSTCAAATGQGVSVADAQAAQDQCKKCQDAGISNFSLIFGILGQWPTMLTNLQRSTAFGDINCQATMGRASNVWGFIMNMVSVMAFNTACYKNMPTAVGGNTISWSHGFGWICLLFSLCIKVPDCIGHLLIPTAHARHVAPDPKFTDVTEYMMTAVEAPGQNTMPGTSVGKEDA